MLQAYRIGQRIKYTGLDKATYRIDQGNKQPGLGRATNQKEYVGKAKSIQSEIRLNTAAC